MKNNTERILIDLASFFLERLPKIIVGTVDSEDMAFSKFGEGMLFVIQLWKINPMLIEFLTTLELDGLRGVLDVSI